jgi:hypothetical protein
MTRTESGNDATDQSGCDLATELRCRFSFTRSEANVALLIAGGLPYTEVAGRLDISYHGPYTRESDSRQGPRLKQRPPGGAHPIHREGWAQAR